MLNKTVKESLQGIGVDEGETRLPRRYTVELTMNWTRLDHDSDSSLGSKKSKAGPQAFTKRADDVELKLLQILDGAGGQGMRSIGFCYHNPKKAFNCS